MKPEPKIYYHRLVTGDVREALQYYQQISPTLGNSFREELEASILAAAKQPLRSHPVQEFRRVNLRRFPYHFLFQIVDDGIRVMLVRHHRRHPSFGLTRG